MMLWCNYTHSTVTTKRSSKIHYQVLHLSLLSLALIFLYMAQQRSTVIQVQLLLAKRSKTYISMQAVANENLVHYVDERPGYEAGIHFVHRF